MRRDKEILNRFQTHKARHEDYVNKEVRSDAAFVRLGDGGRPLATNIEEFVAAHQHYAALVEENEYEIWRQLRWIYEQVTANPELEQCR